MAASNQTLPPAQPTFILRGHQSEIHAISFYAGNRRLLTGDGDGFVISWDLTTKRPVVGWRAHSKATLGVSAWGNNSDDDNGHYHHDGGSGDCGESTLITHGRDGRIAVWRLDRATERLMHQYVAPDQLESVTAKPAVLQELEVGTVSFCPFAVCDAPLDMAFAGMSLGGGGNKGEGQDQGDDEAEKKTTRTTTLSSWARKPLLLAAPSPKNSEDIDVYYMPAGTRKSTVVAPKGPRSGMVMAMVINAAKELTLAAGYENGDVMVYRHDVISDAWQIRYRARPHSQPVLSLCLHPALRVCISSSADAIIAKHPFADNNILDLSNDKPLKIVQTKHSGQQGLSMRNDGRLFALAGWDSRIRIYSARNMRELAVLKLHRQGCYATAFARVDTTLDDPSTEVKERNYGNIVVRLDRINRKYHLRLQVDGPQEPSPSQEEELLWSSINDKVAELKHESPESLHRKLDEYEVWANDSHRLNDDQRNAAVDLGMLTARSHHGKHLLDLLQNDTLKEENKKDASGAEILVPETPIKSKSMLRYEEKARSTHWLTAGSKDGTISLWDVF